MTNKPETFEMSADEADALAATWDRPEAEYVGPANQTLAAAAERWRDLSAPIKVGDIVHFMHGAASRSARMEVVYIHNDEAAVIDGDGDLVTFPLVRLAKGERP